MINQVAQSTRLAVQGNATGWYYVRLPNGTYGWVMSAYSRPIHPDTKAGKPIDLTTMQFELLWYLVKRSGRVVSRDERYEALYNEKYNGFDRRVDVYISRIRQQLKDDVDNPSFLKTIRGVGYLFVGHDGNGG
jgi:DNA-binding response OmpR family regulator